MVIEHVTEITPSRALISAGWEDVAHLDEKTKSDLLRSTPPYLREARSKGIPNMGAGAIYPIPLEEISVPPMAIPAWWTRGYALDVGWNRTAALWGAYDRESDVLYFTSEYYAGQQLPSVHATAIKTRGDWMRGLIDPAARGRSQRDGLQIIADYEQAGLHIVPADNAVEAGLLETWERLATGRLKVFSNLRNFQNEYRIYRRDEHGQVVKKNDHLMDTMRYNVMKFLTTYQTKPVPQMRGGALSVADMKAGY